MVACTGAIVLSGGWGSPFWHTWLSSLILPCLIFGFRWSMVLAAGYITVLTAVLGVIGEGANGTWLGSQRYFYVGAMFTLFLLSGVVGYLGDVCFKVQRRKIEAEAALRNLGTMLEITWSFAVITSNANEMMRRVARTIGERNRNGKMSNSDCQHVRRVNVCAGDVCNLVQLGAHLSADGDSGGPVYLGHTAYGIHKGWMHDPFPFKREVFSQAHLVDDVFGTYVATE